MICYPVLMDWENTYWVAFDTETSGAYPVGSEVVEFGLVKYKGTNMVDQYQVLLRPRRPIPPDVVAIHGITNEQLADQPMASEKASEIRSWFEGATFAVAHHAPFDMGFMAWMFESQGVSLPSTPVLCTSLLARKLVQGTVNHKLQTLAVHFGIPSGQAHRALDDARVCAELFIHLSRHHPAAALVEWEKLQGHRLLWSLFSLKQHPHPSLPILVDAIQKEQGVKIWYQKGSLKHEPFVMKPLGVVLTPLDGDYVPGYTAFDGKRRRYQLEFLQWAELSPFSPVIG